MHNIAQYAALLDDTLVAPIAAGRFSIDVVASEPLPVHPADAGATRRRAGQARLGDASGELLDCVDGETFAQACGRHYDNHGKLRKLAIAGYSHPDHRLPQNAASDVPVLDANDDDRSAHRAALQPRTVVGARSHKATDSVVRALRMEGRCGAAGNGLGACTA